MLMRPNASNPLLILIELRCAMNDPHSQIRGPTLSLIEYMITQTNRPGMVGVLVSCSYLWAYNGSITTDVTMFLGE